MRFRGGGIGHVNQDSRWKISDEDSSDDMVISDDPETLEADPVISALNVMDGQSSTITVEHEGEKESRDPDPDSDPDSDESDSDDSGSGSDMEEDSESSSSDDSGSEVDMGPEDGEGNIANVDDDGYASL